MASTPPSKAPKKKAIFNLIQRSYDNAIKFIPSSSRQSLPRAEDTATPFNSIASSIPALESQTILGSSLTHGISTSATPSTSTSTGPVTRVTCATPLRSPRPTVTGKLKGAGKEALVSLEGALQVLLNSVHEVPALKEAICGVIACLDIVELAAENITDYRELVEELTLMASNLGEYMNGLGPEGCSSTVERIAGSIRAEVDRINERQSRSTGRRLLGSAQDKQDVLKCYRKIEGLFRQLQGDISLQTWKHATKVSLQHFTALLQSVSPVDDARYNSAYSTTFKRGGCTPETRQAVQGNIQNWACDPASVKIYWMNGMAGTGKTTIAYSLCEWLEDNHRLGASFFCSRSLPTCCNVNLIAPTIAYQLAWKLPGFQLALCKALETDPNISKLNVVRQFEALIQEPLSIMNKDTFSSDLVVVIDALDECGDDYGVRLVVQTLVKLCVNLPLKFFVTSRPEPAVLDSLPSPPNYPLTLMHLHDVEQPIIEDDIRRYLKHEFKSVQLATGKIEQLAKQSGNLFIYAATAVRYILSGKGDPVDRLDAMLGIYSQSTDTDCYSKRYKDLDALYSKIVTDALNDDALESVEAERMRLVLWTVVCAKEPLTILTLASFAGVTESQTLSSLKPLYSVLHVSEGSRLVSTLHASFPNYILDHRRSGDLHCEQARHSSFMAYRSFTLMQKELCFNICHLNSSLVYDRDVPNLPQRIEKHISSPLFYACQHWGAHLRLANISDILVNELADFLTHRLLFWMEVLTLKLCLLKGVSILFEADSWLLVTGAHATIQKFITDARDFVARFAASACIHSTPHIYISALPFCAKSSSVYAHYWGRTQGLMKVHGTVINNRDKAAQAAWMASSEILSIAISPSGRYIAAGLADSTVCVWDTHTTDIIAGPFKGHRKCVYSVTFSPDSMFVASGSADGTIRVWDVRTGIISFGPLRGHTRSVRSVAFSSHGKWIASGSNDTSIRVWATFTTDMNSRSLNGHTGSVISIKFSPNSRYIVSGSEDRTVRIWDACNGTGIAGPFQGHTGSVQSVTFSPDGMHIASGSDDCTIRVWDIHTSAPIAVLFDGHSEPIKSIAYSPDGIHIASGSKDETVLVWDTDTRKVVAGPHMGHTAWVNSIVFSPNGSHVISGSSDKTIRSWDFRFSLTTTERFEGGHKHFITSVAFSPTGAQIVSGSRDRTIRVWDGWTGTAAIPPLKGHTGPVYSIAVSPDGTRVASGSGDCTIRVWDLRTECVVVGPLLGHNQSVRSVSFSSDGTKIVSGSDDKTIQVWDAQAGICLAGPFTEHGGPVYSVCFSPDGSSIASGSGDRTVRVWDLRTHGIVNRPLEGHTRAVRSVAFSPDGICIASCSDDKSIRVWNTMSGDCIAELLEAHTGPISSVSFSPNGRYIVSGSSDSTVGVWDILGDCHCIRIFSEHTRSVNSVGFSPDGARIVSGSGDQAIRVISFPHDIITAFSSNSSGPSIISRFSDSGVGRSDQKTTIVLADPPSSDGLEIHKSDIVDDASPLMGNFQLQADGWATSDGALLFWAPLDLRAHIPHPGNSLVIGLQGSLQIDYSHIVLGKQWFTCYNSS